MSVRFSNNNLTYEIPSRYDEESISDLVRLSIY